MPLTFGKNQALSPLQGDVLFFDSGYFLNNTQIQNLKKDYFVLLQLIQSKYNMLILICQHIFKKRLKNLKNFFQPHIRNCEEINFKFMRRIICSEQGKFSQEY